VAARWGVEIIRIKPNRLFAEQNVFFVSQADFFCDVDRAAVFAIDQGDQSADAK
jgi:hypothetical protein